LNSILFGSTSAPARASFAVASLVAPAAGPNLFAVVPLVLACFAVLIAIPATAARGKLHVPGYAGLAFLGFALGLLVARISGARSITGTLTGLSLSILFFLLMATAVGSVLAIFFYRHPEV
jgi:hypothetical protein